MKQQPKTPGAANLAVHRMVEDIVGCKWSLAVLDQVRRGVQRPGALEQAIPGISTKVLNERLRKLTRFGILTRRSYAVLPPRVEYRLTGFGQKLGSILDQIAALQPEAQATRRAWDASQSPPDPPSARKTR